MLRLGKPPNSTCRAAPKAFGVGLGFESLPEHQPPLKLRLGKPANFLEAAARRAPNSITRNTNGSHVFPAWRRVVLFLNFPLNLRPFFAALPGNPRAVILGQMNQMIRSVIAAGTCCLFTSLNSLFAQATAFTYQGSLNDIGGPASGHYDLRFALYDSTNNPGNLVAGPITNSAVIVTNGLFTTTVDFGSNPFNGSARWLEIGVRTNGAANFITLAPRQVLTPAPFALFADSASNLLGTIPGSQISGSVVYATSAGNAALLSGQPPSYYLDLSNQTGTLSASQLPAGAINSRGVLATDYEFDETSGTTFADSSGFGNDAIAPIGGISAGSAGHSGKAVYFAGGFLKVASGIPDSPQVWVETWVNPQSSSPGVHTVLSKSGAWSLQITNGVSGPGTAIFSVTTANGTFNLVSSVPVNSGTWSHAAAWYNGQAVTLEINGAAIVSTFGGGAVVPTMNNPLYIGAADDAADQSFFGLIDEVRIRMVAPPTTLNWPQISYSTYSTPVTSYNLTNYSPYAEVRSFTFNKLMASTRLRITYNDSIQVTGQGAVPVAATWEVLLDGNPVSPAPMKFTYYDPQDTGIVLPVGLTGWGTGVGTGVHSLKVTVKAATTGGMTAYTGSQIGAGLLQVEEQP